MSCRGDVLLWGLPPSSKEGHDRGTAEICLNRHVKVPKSDPDRNLRLEGERIGTACVHRWGMSLGERHESRGEGGKNRNLPPERHLLPLRVTEQFRMKANDGMNFSCSKHNPHGYRVRR